MNSHLILYAKDYFFDLHDNKVNQKYGGSANLPYSFHLNSVFNFGKKFIHLINQDDKCNVLISCLAHDCIEDARLSYNDIVKDFNKEIAEIVFICTEMRGRNRSERKDQKFYDELKQNDLAIFVKLCDIIANSTFSLSTQSSMFKMYKKEYCEKVKPNLYCEKYKEMFDFLEKLYNIG